jgi:hypothetical protein
MPVEWSRLNGVSVEGRLLHRFKDESVRLALSVIEHHIGSSSALSVVVDYTGLKVSVDLFRLKSVSVR